MRFISIIHFYFAGYDYSYLRLGIQLFAFTLLKVISYLHSIGYGFSTCLTVY